MDCNAAEPFVSALYDAEAVPEEAVRHIMTCDTCQVRLQDYARITSGMRLLAAQGEGGKNPSVSIGYLPARKNWFGPLGKSVRVPRLLIAAFLVVLGVATIGWLRTGAQGKLVTRFWCEMKMPNRSQGASRLEVGSPDSGSSFSGNEGYGYKLEALSISDKAVHLRVRFKHFTQFSDWDTVQKEVEKVAPQEITYIPGEQISVPIENGGNALLQGSVRHDPQFPEPESKPAASLLPGPDEVDINAPVFIRGGKELLAYTSSSFRFPCDKASRCGFFLYVPGEGEFFFSPQQLENGIQGTAFMSEIVFEEEGNSYSLFSRTPIFGGEQPRKVWIEHDKNYLPSQHGAGKSSDALTSLGDVVERSKSEPWRNQR